MIEETYYKKNKTETILNRAKEYYENDKERLREQAKNKYRELSEEKNKKESMEEMGIVICLKKINKY